VNYFEDHIGDYAAATAHLTWDEDMAYTRLIRAYYHTEKPIPKDKAHRLARAVTPAQRRAVDSVLVEFFTLQDNCYCQKRCDEEIARFQDKQDKAKRSADARWNAHRSQSDRNANASTNAMRTHSEGNAPSLQTPDTIPNKKNTSASAPPPSGVSDSVWADFLKIRKAKRAPMTDTALEGIRREAAKAGMTLADALAMCCTRGWQGFEAKWLEDKKTAFTPPSPAVTVPRKPGIDPALAKCYADAKICKPMPIEMQKPRREPSGARA